MAQKIIIGSAVFLAIAIVAGVYITQIKQPDTGYKFSEPEQTVRQYFESWNKKDWPNMYSVISDGFKKIDPDAKTLGDFKKYAESQGISSIIILSINGESNDGKTAVVDYSVEFVLSDGAKRPFTDTFTLKYRESDIIRGWKLVHPYGTNIDIS